MVYDCMDEWNTFPGIEEPVLEAEHRLVRDADILLVSSEQLRRKWRRCNNRTLLVRNAVDFEYFTTPIGKNVLADKPRPIIGYFRGISEWVDIELLSRLARERTSLIAAFTWDSMARYWATRSTKGTTVIVSLSDEHVCHDVDFAQSRAETCTALPPSLSDAVIASRTFTTPRLNGPSDRSTAPLRMASKKDRFCTFW